MKIEHIYSCIKQSCYGQLGLVIGAKIYDNKRQKEESKDNKLYEEWKKSWQTMHFWCKFGQIGG